MNNLSFLPAFDWAALLLFVAAWMAYAWYAKHRALHKPSLLAATNRFRLEWMRQTTARDPRMLDGLITQSLSTTPSFFCSTTILVIGGLLAVLGTSDKAAELVRDIPFVARTSVLIFDVKLITMVVVFVYAFFRFSWSMRQYTFVSLIIGGMPSAAEFAKGMGNPESYAKRAANMVAMAAETFNDGLRAYYFAFAIAAWFLSPLAFMFATAGVVAILYRREFQSDFLALLEDPIN